MRAPGRAPERWGLALVIAGSPQRQAARGRRGSAPSPDRPRRRSAGTVSPPTPGMGFQGGMRVFLSPAVVSPSERRLRTFAAPRFSSGCSACEYGAVSCILLPLPICTCTSFTLKASAFWYPGRPAVPSSVSVIEWVVLNCSDAG